MRALCTTSPTHCVWPRVSRACRLRSVHSVCGPRATLAGASAPRRAARRPTVCTACVCPPSVRSRAHCALTVVRPVRSRVVRATVAPPQIVLVSRATLSASIVGAAFVALARLQSRIQPPCRRSAPIGSSLFEDKKGLLPVTETALGSYLVGIAGWQLSTAPSVPGPSVNENSLPSSMDGTELSSTDPLQTGRVTQQVAA